MKIFPQTQNTHSMITFRGKVPRVNSLGVTDLIRTEVVSDRQITPFREFERHGDKGVNIVLLSFSWMVHPNNLLNYRYRYIHRDRSIESCHGPYTFHDTFTKDKNNRWLIWCRVRRYVDPKSLVYTGGSLGFPRVIMGQSLNPSIPKE